jgi:hypothetical protein
MYTERTSCIFCDGTEFTEMFRDDERTIYQGCYPIAPVAPTEEVVSSPKTMPYNVLVCENCKTHQLKWLGDMNEIYNYNATAFGSVRDNVNKRFTSFILEEPDITGIIEIGGGNGCLSDMILGQATVDMPYTIVDPSYSGSEAGKTVVRAFFEDIANDVDADSGGGGGGGGGRNTVIMSHVYEHFYKPLDILHKIHMMPNVEYLYICFPDLQKYVETDNYQVLTPEHTFYVENQFLVKTFEFNGFKLIKYEEFDNHSVMLGFVKARTPRSVTRGMIAAVGEGKFVNMSAERDVRGFFDRAFAKVRRYNAVLSVLGGGSKTNYIWPCSIHTVFLLTLGLDPALFTAVLDNSPGKIGKSLYGYNLPCLSFQTVLAADVLVADGASGKRIVMNAGCFNKEVDVVVGSNAAIEFIV